LGWCQLGLTALGLDRGGQHHCLRVLCAGHLLDVHRYDLSGIDDGWMSGMGIDLRALGMAGGMKRCVICRSDKQQHVLAMRGRVVFGVDRCVDRRPRRGRACRVWDSLRRGVRRLVPRGLVSPCMSGSVWQTEVRLCESRGAGRVTFGLMSMCRSQRVHPVSSGVVCELVRWGWIVVDDSARLVT
jgi:hypothetical protein